VYPSATGIAVSNSLQLLLFVPWLVRMFVELDGSMSSISALVYFGKNAPKEVICLFIFVVLFLKSSRRRLAKGQLSLVRLGPAGAK
jgi:hypothetical protein